MAWDPEVYNKFRSERKQPFYDCLQLIERKPAMEIIDLGCGTGELTFELASLMPDPELVLGIDASAEMLSKSSGFTNDKLFFRQSTIERELMQDKHWDLIFSHAALQWIDGHEMLLTSLVKKLNTGGQLLIQMPSQTRNITNLLLADLAASARYRSAFKDWKRESPVLAPEKYAELFFRLGGDKIQVFEKIYPVIVKDTTGLFDWVSGTALLPYLDQLNGDERAQFVSDFKSSLEKNFKDEPVFYPFKRLILSAVF